MKMMANPWENGKSPLAAGDKFKSISNGKGYIKVQGWQKVPKGPSLAKGI